MPYRPTRQQRAIIGHDPDRHARVLAGPGSGKSATIVAWLERILGEDDPPRARLLTFTRAATGELARKVVAHPHVSSERPGTVHSFAISVLLQNPDVADFPQPLRIADDWEDSNVVRLSLRTITGLPQNTIKKLFTELAGGWESLDPAFRDPRITAANRNRFRAAWQNHRRVYGYTLLGELPYSLRAALQEHEDLVGVDYDLLVIDEYQDLNACDLDVCRLMAERDCQIVAIGDDDQSIYSFRQADPSGVRNFCDEFENAADYPLTITHRCGRNIIDWAYSVIEGDLTRDPDKERLRTANGAPDGEVALLQFPGEVSEAQGIAVLVEKLIEVEEIEPSQILILLRGDYQGSFSRPIKAALDALGIQYSDPDVVKNILAAETNRRLLARLRLMLNREDSLAWATLLHLQRGVGQTIHRRVYDQAAPNDRTFGAALIERVGGGLPEINQPTRGRIVTLVTEMLAWLNDHEIPDDTPDGGWGPWIVQLAVDELGVELEDNFVQLLTDVTSQIETDQAFERFMNQLTPIAKDIAQTKAAGVRIMSMAASKGLTVDATIIAGLETDVIPRPGQDPNEERRLLYVGMTRATRFLYGTWARQRRGPGARAGRGRVAERRNRTELLAGGPVRSQDGARFMAARWPD